MSNSGKLKKLHSSFETIAAFWLPESPDKTFGGILKGSRGRIEFLTSPSYKQLTDNELHEAFMSWGTPNSKAHLEVLHGRTNDEICSLFWLQELSRPGVIDHRDGTQLSSIRYRAKALLTDLHVGSADADEIDEASFSFSTLHTFYSVPITQQMSEDIGQFSYPSRGVALFSFCSLGLEAEIELKVVPEGRHSHAKGLVLKSKPRVHIKPTHPRSVVWFSELRTRLENFFSLVMGTSVTTNAVQLFKGQVSGFLIERRPAKREKANYEIRVNSAPHVLGQALCNWLAIPRDEQPVERTFLMVVRKSDLFTETEFLSLSQAIEGFGRLHFKECLIPKGDFRKGLVSIRTALHEAWGDNPIIEKALANLSHANELSFGERIGKMYDMLSTTFAAKVLERVS